MKNILFILNIQIKINSNIAIENQNKIILKCSGFKISIKFQFFDTQNHLNLEKWRKSLISIVNHQYQSSPIVERAP